MYIQEVLADIRYNFIPDIFMIIYIISFIAIYVGMFNPRLVLGCLNVRKTKGMVLIIYGSVFVSSFIINILLSR